MGGRGRFYGWGATVPAMMTLADRLLLKKTFPQRHWCAASSMDIFLGTCWFTACQGFFYLHHAAVRRHGGNDLGDIQLSGQQGEQSAVLLPHFCCCAEVRR